MSPENQELFDLFLAYLSIKGRKEVEKEWLKCEGPHYSIWVRNTFGVAVFKKPFQKRRMVAK
jgi:hypothetical protein